MDTDIQFLDLQNSVRIAYLEHKNPTKPVLFFIHGLGNYLRVWELNIVELKKHFHCIAIDLPGNGLSSRGNYDFCMGFYSSTIVEFIALKKLKNVTLVGHSMGGQIAIQCALQNTPLVKKLILCASAGFEYFTHHEIFLFKNALSLTDMMNTDESNITQAIQSSFFKANFITQKIIDDLKKMIGLTDKKTYRKMLQMSIHSMLDHQVYHQLKDVKIPTLIIFGENDMLIPNKFFHATTIKTIAEKGAKQIENSTLLLVKNAGHFVQIEQATEVNVAIQNWMERT